MISSPHNSYPGKGTKSIVFSASHETIGTSSGKAASPHNPCPGLISKVVFSTQDSGIKGDIAIVPLGAVHLPCPKGGFVRIPNEPCAGAGHSQGLASPRGQDAAVLDMKSKLRGG